MKVLGPRLFALAFSFLCAATVLLSGQRNPGSPAPTSTATIISRVTSLQVEYTPLGANSGIVTVHNLSGNAVTALRIGARQGSNGWAQGADWNGRQPLIAPGGSYQMHVTPSASSSLIHGKLVENPPFRTLVLQAVLFEGGGYGGEMEIAAEMAAFQIGEEAEAQLIRGIVAPIIAGNQPDSIKLRQIVAAVTPLPTVGTARMLATLRARFPKLPDSDAQMARDFRFFSQGLSDQKEGFLSTLRENAEIMKENPNPLPLAKYWEAGCPLCRSVPSPCDSTPSSARPAPCTRIPSGTSQ